jgi:hypothetical protein
MRWLLAIFLAIVAAVAAAILFLIDLGKSKSFRQESEQIFTDLREGKAEKVYEEASFRFKQTLLVDKFVDLVERMNTTMGRFQRVAKVIDVDRSTSVAGSTARVRLALEFERAATRGELSFHRRRPRPGSRAPEAWRLLGMSVDIPGDDLVAEAKRLENAIERRRAPGEVIERFHGVLEDVRDQNASRIYEAAAPSFRETTTLEQFQNLLEAHRAEMGSFGRVLAVISSAQNPARDRARVHALLQYERAKTTGTFEFLRVAGEWRMYGFRVVVPEPYLPPRDPVPPETP